MNIFAICVFIIFVIISQISAQLGGFAVSDPRGGQYGGLSYNKQFGNENHRFGGNAFIEGHSRGGPPTYGGKANYDNINGHGLSVHHSRTPGVSSNTGVAGTLNVYDRGDHKVNVNAWHDRTKFRNKRQANGYDSYGGNVEWQHRNGHSASIGTNKIPQFNQQTIDANAKYNIWRSNDHRTTFDANAAASHNIGQFNHGKTDYNAGLRLIHRFKK